MKNRRSLIDETGNKYGMLTVIERAQESIREVSWLCICDCGNYTVCTGTGLRANKIKSCGCLSGGRPIVDLTGNTYGKLTVVSKAYSEKGRVYWNCSCVCGKNKVVAGGDLKKGTTYSCGCARKEAQHKRSAKGQVPFNLLYGEYQRNAIRRKMEFCLTADQFKSLIFSDCVYCGDAPNREKKTAIDSILYNGVDRIASSKGYTLDNCVSCCWDCNRMKGEMSHADFIKKVRKINEYSCNNR